VRLCILHPHCGHTLTFTAYLAFDAEGGSTYTWSVPGKFATASYTNMDTVVTLSGGAQAAGARCRRHVLACSTACTACAACIPRSLHTTPW
jgi:hypothetical protein